MCKVFINLFEYTHLIFTLTKYSYVWLVKVIFLFQATYKNLERDKSKLEEEILLLEKELEKGRAKLHEEDELVSLVYSKRIMNLTY